MSIYATLWSIQFQDPEDMEWVEVTAQGVPNHIDMECEWLPPPIPEDSHSTRLRAVVFVTNDTQKGTERSGQEYVQPLLVITGDEYAESTFPALLERLWTAMGRKGLGCTHDWELIRPIAISPRDAAESVTQQEILDRVVPYEWCRRCGALHHDFRGNARACSSAIGGPELTERSSERQYCSLCTVRTDDFVTIMVGKFWGESDVRFVCGTCNRRIEVASREAPKR